jgi:hypothetical protein
MKRTPLNTAKAVKTYQERRKAKLIADRLAGIRPSGGLKKEGRRANTMKARDKAARQECLARGHCQAEGYRFACDGRLCWCHIITRICLLLRWSPRNCLCLCLRHEMWFTAHPKAFKTWVNRKFSGLYDVLKRESNTPKGIVEDIAA